MLPLPLLRPHGWTEMFTIIRPHRSTS